MRIKAVLRDSDILKMSPGSDSRIDACIEKNENRFVSWSSLLKVMGLSFEDRIKMLERMQNKKIHIWLGAFGGQDVIYLSKNNQLDEPEFTGYKWQ